MQEDDTGADGDTSPPTATAIPLAPGVVTQSSAEAADAVPPIPELPQLPGEPIAFDDRGRPTIARVVDTQTGSSQTMVLNQEDGSITAFGDNSLASLLLSGSSDVGEFIENLTQHQLRGLVHEIGQRLVKNSQTYQCFKSEWDKLTEAQDCQFFGFSAEPTEKQLDNAYRKLARQMHPDKNGGTEEAKDRFQAMKSRYERLKEKIAAGPKKEEIVAEADEQTDKKDTGTLAYDPNDRDNLVENTWKMISQLQGLTTGVQDLQKKLAKAQQ